MKNRARARGRLTLKLFHIFVGNALCRQDLRRRGTIIISAGILPVSLIVLVPPALKD